MITCEPSAEGKAKVTFTLPCPGPAASVAVLGDFNEWDPTAMPMRKTGDVQTASVVLEGGRRYFFRYLDEGGRWFNDEAADDYQPNDFGGSDSVVDLTASG